MRSPVIVTVTRRLISAGEEVCERLASWGAQLSEALQHLSSEERASLERGLGAVIWSLRAAGYLTVAEPCRGCVHFSENAAPHQPEPHRCALLQRFISEKEARKDCPEHQPRTQDLDTGYNLHYY